MDFLKFFFNDDDYLVGLSGFKTILAQEGENLKVQVYGGNFAQKPIPQSPYNIFTLPQNMIFSTNTKNNFLLS